MAIFSIIDGPIFIILLYRELCGSTAKYTNLGRTTAWLRSVTFWGYLRSAREFETKILYKNQTKTRLERFSYIICELHCGIICRLIDIAFHAKKNYNYSVKSCKYYRPDKVFSRVCLLIQNLSLEISRQTWTMYR